MNSTLWVFAGIASSLLAWWGFVRVFAPRPVQPQPIIKVIETVKYGGSFESGPSDTMMLLWRLYPTEMRKGHSSQHPGFIHAQRTEDNTKVVVFMIVKDQAVVFDDDGAIFPSDTLITKIRMLK